MPVASRVAAERGPDLVAGVADRPETTFEALMDYHDHGEVEYECVEPFDIDHGELDGLRPNAIFTLGVEWEMIRQELDTGRVLARMIHAENFDRFKKMCQRRGREFVASEVNGEWVRARLVQLHGRVQLGFGGFAVNTLPVVLSLVALAVSLAALARRRADQLEVIACERERPRRHSYED